MTPSSIIESAAEAAYLNGATPLNVGIAVAEIVCEETLNLPCHDPAVRLLARRLISAVLDCGWSPPPTVVRESAD